MNSKDYRLSAPYTCASCGSPKSRTEDDLCPECRLKAGPKIQPIADYILNFNAKIVEEQENIIHQTISRAAGKEYRNITVDKSKVLEALKDYTQRGEQLPLIKKPEVLKAAIAIYGQTAQVDMAIEEMSELTKALCKERRTQLIPGKHAEAHANVIEEIADVAIMLKQLLIMFDKDGEIQKEVDYKIDRLEQRLQKAHKETGGQSV